jgi:hypothetical protein
LGTNEKPPARLTLPSHDKTTKATDTMNSNLALIPPTTRETYLTGQVALNIPAPEGTCGDWHKHAIFMQGGDLTPWLGGGKGRFFNTNPFLGDMGIHECSTWLVNQGYHNLKNQQVFAANHYRAIMDQVIHEWHNGNIPPPVTFHDYVSEKKHQKEFLKLLDQMGKKFPNDLKTTFDLWLQTETQIEKKRWEGSP